MKAIDFLNKAAGIMKERGKQYDKPEGERSMGRTVQAFNTITGRDLTEAEGWLLLQILKDVRQWQRPQYHADSAEDAVAYAALKAEALAAGEGGVQAGLKPDAPNGKRNCWTRAAGVEKWSCPDGNHNEYACLGCLGCTAA